MSEKLDKKATEELLKLADHFDNIGMHKEADYVDFILRKNAEQDILSGVLSELPSNYDPIRGIKRQAIIALMEYFGAKKGSWMALFLSNFISGISDDDFSLIMYSYGTGDTDTLCDIISEEVASALQKSTFESTITEGAETAFENFIFKLIGVEASGTLPQLISSVIGPDILVQMLTTYVTDNNAVSKKMAEVICQEVIPSLGGALQSGYSWLTGAAQSTSQALSQGYQNARNPGQFAVQQAANQVLGPTYGPQAVGLAQQVGMLP